MPGKSGSKDIKIFKIERVYFFVKTYDSKSEICASGFTFFKHCFIYATMISRQRRFLLFSFFFIFFTLFTRLIFKWKLRFFFQFGVILRVNGCYTVDVK